MGNFLFIFCLIVTVIGITVGVQNNEYILVYAGILYGILVLYVGIKYKLYKLDNYNEKEKNIC